MSPSKTGAGAMIHYLSGGSPEDPAKYYGRTITAASLAEERAKTIRTRHSVTRCRLTRDEVNSR